jgi:hypothetical protein
MRWCETLVFRRVLSEYERQIVREYIQDRYAIASPAIVGPDREILKLVPFCDFRAGAFTLAGANASAFLDKARIGHSFGAAVAQQVVAPTPSALFGGAPAAIFGGASSYTSNLVASSWNFLVRGTGATVFFAYAPQNPTQNSLLLASATGIAAGVTGFTLFSTPGVGTIQAFAIDAATAVSSIAGPPQVQGVGTLVSWRQRDAGTPRATLKVSGSAVSTNNILLAGPSSSSQVMTLGRSASDVMRAAWESLLVFDRELTSEEYAIVYNAILTRTGLVS